MVQEKCPRFAACGSDDALRPEAKEEVEILYWQWRHSGGRRKSERQFIQEIHGKKTSKDSSVDCNFGVFNVITNAMTLHAPKDVMGSSNQCKSSEGNAIRAHQR